MRPGAPAAILSLRALSSSVGSQPSSSSAPPSMSTSSRFSVTMWLGLASTKCGSSVGLASAFTSIRSPPISRATAARSGVVATTLSLACATTGKSTSRAGRIRLFTSIPLELVRRVRTQQELELQPRGGVVPHALAVVEVVLEPHLGELARIPGQVRRDPGAVLTQFRVGHVSDAAGEFAAQARHPARRDAPEHLRIDPPVVQRVLGQRQRGILCREPLSSLVASKQGLRLEGDKREPLPRIRGLPLPVE